jgi:hypothetical protein
MLWTATVRALSRAERAKKGRSPLWCRGAAVAAQAPVRPVDGRAQPERQHHVRLGTTIRLSHRLDRLRDPCAEIAGGGTTKSQAGRPATGANLAFGRSDKRRSGHPRPSPLHTAIRTRKMSCSMKNGKCFDDDHCQVFLDFLVCLVSQPLPIDSPTCRI